MQLTNLSYIDKWLIKIELMRTKQDSNELTLLICTKRTEGIYAVEKFLIVNKHNMLTLTLLRISGSAYRKYTPTLSTDTGSVGFQLSIFTPSL